VSEQQLEIELLQERVDSMQVANEELRERLNKTTNEIVALVERCQYLELKNKDLSAQIDRLRIHLQQGVEL
jgi:flagellar biosynthesis/type III secretory pathway chaperone